MQQAQHSSTHTLSLGKNKSSFFLNQLHNHCPRHTLTFTNLSSKRDTLQQNLLKKTNVKMSGGGGGGKNVCGSEEKKKDGPAVGVWSENLHITLLELTSDRCAATSQQEAEFTHHLATTDLP